MSTGIKIPFYRPYYNNKEIKAVTQTLNSGWSTSGPKVKEFEKKFAIYIGAKYCVVVNSCAAAIFLSLKYLSTKNKKIKTVYVPSFTYAATANEILHAGLKIKWGDVDKQGLLIKPEQENFDLAIPVHYAGQKADTNYKVPVIEDSAHLIKKNQCKNNPNLVCFSFYATKNIGMGEGGAVCTNNKKIYNWLVQARSHGITKDGFDRYHGNWRYDIDFIGWKANLSDIQASIGLVQLDKFPIMQIKRQNIIDRYNKKFNLNNKGLHLYPILVKNRDEFIRKMNMVGIQTSVHFIPLHWMKAYKNLTPQKKLSNTDWLGKHVVSLPLYPSLTNQQINYICKMTLKYADFI